MKLTKKQRAHNTATSMVGTLSSIANEYRQILTKGTNMRGQLLGAPEDIKAAFGTEQIDAVQDFVKAFADEEKKEEIAAAPGKKTAGARPQKPPRK